MRINGSNNPLNFFDPLQNYEQFTQSFRENAQQLLHLAKNMDLESRRQYSKLEHHLHESLPKLHPEDVTLARIALEEIQRVSDTSHQMLLFEEQIKNAATPHEYYQAEKLFDEAKDEQGHLANLAFNRLQEWM